MDCRRLAGRRGGKAVIAAFTQACREAGIPPHPGGECPAPGCRCKDEGVAEQVEARTAELAAARLGIRLEG